MEARTIDRATPRQWATALMDLYGKERAAAYVKGIKEKLSGEGDPAMTFWKQVHEHMEKAEWET